MIQRMGLPDFPDFPGFRFQAFGWRRSCVTNELCVTSGRHAESYNLCPAKGNGAQKYMQTY